MLDKFKEYLIKKGYREYTKSGNKSTVYDYLRRIGNMCEREKCSIEELKSNISYYVKKYDAGGRDEKYGLTSHSSVINALKRFEEFVSE